MSRVTHAYLAGFFDGEGSVGLYWQKQKRLWAPSLAIELKTDTRNVATLREIARLYGGRVSITPRAASMRIRRKSKILLFIEHVLPHTRIKTTQLILLRSWLQEGTYGYRISQLLKTHKRRV